jgi:hypothetical protein
VPKPKPSACAQDWRGYRQRCRRENLSTAALAALVQTRRRLDKQPPAQDRLLIVAADGSYTNQTLLKGLPPRTSLIGRIRKDARLFHPPTPAEQQPRGTRRRYGRLAPTPRQLLQDDNSPWQEVSAFAAGKLHTFRIKTLAPLLWPKAGPARPLRLVVIAPVGYRLRAGGRLLYRQPAYLVCTDPDLPLPQLLQYYLWRWDIEVNHRDEKQIIGVGQAQVRSPQAVERDPAFAVACYAMLLLASILAYGMPGKEVNFPLPKWRAGKTKLRPSTQDLIQQLRRELWGQALAQLADNSAHFASAPTPVAKALEIRPPLEAAVLYAPAG